MEMASNEVIEEDGATNGMEMASEEVIEEDVVMESPCEANNENIGVHCARMLLPLCKNSKAQTL